jgi:hypothetical protein
MYTIISRPLDQGRSWSWPWTHDGEVAIDRAIFSELDSSESISSGELKIKIEKSLGRSISPSIYSSHVKKMLEIHDIDKTDTGLRGKPSIFYSLNKMTKREWRLNIHRLSPDQIKFRKIYEKIFLYELEGSPAFIISSKKDFDNLLRSEFNMTEDKLRWGRIADADNHVIVDELYGVYSDTKVGKQKKKSHKKEMDEYWKEKRGQKIILEEVERVCCPVRGNLDIQIVETEYWEINKSSKYKKNDTDYRIILPGVAINEFLDNNSIGVFNHSDIEKAISLLVREGMLEPCMTFRGEPRYKIADQRLRYFISTLRDFHYGEFNILLCKWEDFEKPTDNEMQRTWWLLGEEESKRIFRELEIRRHRNKELMKMSKSLEEYYDRYLIERMIPIFATADRYDSYLNCTMTPHLERSKYYLFNYELDEYNRRKGRRAMRSKRAEHEIQEFHIYRRESLRQSEERLKWDAETIKMGNMDVLLEYKFLHHAIRMVCPLVFDHPNTELQTEIVRNEIAKEHATKELAKMLGAIYGNYDYKRKKRLRTRTVKRYNQITGRHERVRIYKDVD